MPNRLEITNYLSERNLRFQVSVNSQINLRGCPFCGDASWYHFYILTEEKKTPNKTYPPGTFNCKKCNASGGWEQFVSKLTNAEPISETEEMKQDVPALTIDLVESYHNLLYKNEIALKYLYSRGFNDKSIKYFKVGCLEDNSGIWIAFPSLREGKVEDINFRLITGKEKRYKRTGIGKVILYNQDAIKDYKEVFVVEGEPDCITLWQAGVKNICAVLGANNFPAESYDLLKTKIKVYICLDNDADRSPNVGQVAARKFAERLGFSRCWNITLPVKDVNEYFKDHNISDFQLLVEQAKQYKVESVYSLEEMADEVEKKDDELTGIETGWENVDKLTKRYQPGELTVISAGVGVGKTTFTLNTALYNAHKGIPSLYYCLEVPSKRLYRKIVAYELEISDNYEADITPEMFAQAREKLKGIPFYVGHNFAIANGVEMMSLLSESVKRYNIQLLVFDNINFLVKNIEHTTQEIDKVSKAFKTLSLEYNVATLLIAQLSKIPEDRMPTVQDIRGSSLISADADNVLFLYRKRITTDVNRTEEDFCSLNFSLDPFTIIRLDKSRFSSGGDTALYFDGAKSRFYPIKKEE